jgi:hypothetical protein
MSVFERAVDDLFADPNIARAASGVREAWAMESRCAW